MTRHATSPEISETLARQPQRPVCLNARGEIRPVGRMLFTLEIDGAMKIIRVLVIEDSKTHVQLIRGMLSDTRGTSFAVDVHHQLSTGLQGLDEGHTDVVLLDLTLPDCEGVESCKRVAAHSPNLPIVVLTGVDDEEVALDSLHSGAQDYLVKGQIDGNLLARSLRYAIERKRGQLELQRARNELELRVEQRTAELREMQEAARLRQEELAHVARLNTLGEMASGLAHELNQPLMAITGFADGCLQMLGSKHCDRDQLIEILQDTSAEAHRAGEIIKRLRKMVTKRSTQKLPCDVNELVQDTITLLGKRTAANIDLELAGDLPEVYVDRVQIQQVILNLANNAVQAMGCQPNAADRLTIKTGVDRATVYAEVSDTGPPLTQDAFDHLFQPFFTSKPNGLGLGLSISRSIIEAHAGELTVRRNPDRGLTFLFTLPPVDATVQVVQPSLR